MKKLLALIASIIMILGIANISFAAEDNLLISPYDVSSSLLGGYDSHPALISSNKITVKQNDQYIDFTDSEGNVVDPQIINDRTMVPFRKIFNSFGVLDSNINWNGDTRTVTATKDNITIELQIDNNTAKKTVDGVASEIKLDSAPSQFEVRDDILYVATYNTAYEFKINR